MVAHAGGGGSSRAVCAAGSAGCAGGFVCGGEGGTDALGPVAGAEASAGSGARALAAGGGSGGADASAPGVAFWRRGSTAGAGGSISMEHECGFQEKVGRGSDGGGRSADAVCRSAPGAGVRALAVGGGSDDADAAGDAGWRQGGGPRMASAFVTVAALRRSNAAMASGGHGWEISSSSSDADIVGCRAAGLPGCAGSSQRTAGGMPRAAGGEGANGKAAMLATVGAGAGVGG